MNAAVLASASNPLGRVWSLASSNTEFTIRTFISNPSACVPR